MVVDACGCWPTGRAAGLAPSHFEADGGTGEGEESFLGGDGDAGVASAGEELVAGVDLALVGFEAEGYGRWGPGAFAF